MVNTRSNSREGGHDGRSPQVGAKRLFRELEVDGTTALKGGEIDRGAEARSRTQSRRGGRYEVTDDGISWKTTGVEQTAPREALDASTPPNKRLRKAHTTRPKDMAADLKAGASKKRKLENVSGGADADYLAETIRELKRVKVPGKSSRKADIRMMLPYLKKLEPLDATRTERKIPQSGQARGDAPDAYELSAVDARRFLHSDNQVHAPIFVSGQENPFVVTGNNARPIEQVFDWLDMDDVHETADLEAPVGKDGSYPELTVSIEEIRERFVNNNHSQTYPWNFPEIGLPTVAESMPDFLRNPKCNLVRDLGRHLQETEAEDICPATCPNHGVTAERCPRHFLTPDEVVTFNHVYRHWLGGIMLAEAGAMTRAHFDTFGFATYIVCLEGEIGFAWTGDVTARKRGVNTRDRWVFKVLRAGDAIYLDPGRYHLVFRKPSGQQTLAWGPRVQRYCEINKWLEIISVEAGIAIANGLVNESSLLVWRGVAIAAHYIVSQARRRNRFEKFGGEQTVKAAESWLVKIEKQLQQLL